VHLSDLHIRRRRKYYQRIIAGLTLTRVDLAVMTGDYIDQPGDEQLGLSVMSQICESLKPRLGVYGVFGNHDTPETQKLFEKLPVHWLNNASDRPQGLPLELTGFLTDSQCRPDVVKTMLGLATSGCGTQLARADVDGHDPVVRMLLSHLPTYLPSAADLGIHLMFAGHTHGGQWRLPGQRAIYNSCDLPVHLTSGMLRHRDTLCLVSRGLGETIMPIRFFCPRQLPVYTLRRGSLPGQCTDHIVNVRPW